MTSAMPRLSRDALRPPDVSTSRTQRSTSDPLSSRPRSPSFDIFRTSTAGGAPSAAAPEHTLAPATRRRESPTFASQASLLGFGRHGSNEKPDNLAMELVDLRPGLTGTTSRRATAATAQLDPDGEITPNDALDSFGGATREADPVELRVCRKPLHPFSLTRQRWDMLIALTLLYNGAIIPLSVSFSWVESPSSPYFWIDRLVDLVFLIDIFLNFVTGVITDDGVLSMDRRVIVRTCERYSPSRECERERERESARARARDDLTRAPV